MLRNRVAHLLHLGDTRAYRFNGQRLTCLTIDHVRDDGNARSHTLTRALGAESEVRLDYSTTPVALHDRFLLCSDGVHGFVPEARISEILSARSAPEDTAGALVAAALDYGSNDNCTALVLDVVALPAAGSADLGTAIAQLPVNAVPLGGETIDGFVLKTLISDGRYSRLFAAEDEVGGGNVALKFPKPTSPASRPTAPPSCARPGSELRPDLPAWLDAALARAVAADPARRYGDMIEFALAMEAGPAREAGEIRRPLTLYERAPLRVWQGLAALLALALLASLLTR